MKKNIVVLVSEIANDYTYAVLDGINDLFADKDGKLRDELEQLFVSLFTNHEDCMKIVRFLSKRKTGYTRREIADATKIPYGGGLTKSTC